MSHILALCLLLWLPSCSFLASPAAIVIEEKIAEEVIEEVESLIQKEEAK